MQSTLSSKGQIVIPEALRLQAGLRQGDRVDIGFADGLIVMRKQVPLTARRVRALLAAAQSLPPPPRNAGRRVSDAIRQVRRRWRAS